MVISTVMTLIIRRTNIQTSSTDANGVEMMVIQMLIVLILIVLSINLSGSDRAFPMVPMTMEMAMLIVMTLIVLDPACQSTAVENCGTNRR